MKGIKSHGQRRRGNIDQAAARKPRISAEISSLEAPARISSLSFIPLEMVRRAPKQTTAQMATQLIIGRRKIVRDDPNPRKGRAIAAAGKASVALHNQTREIRSTFESIAASKRKRALRRLTDRRSAAGGDLPPSNGTPG